MRLKSFFVFSLLSMEAKAPTPSPSYPLGYYAFESAPWRQPPSVRKPPYLQTKSPCPSLEAVDTLDNLCGDLNTGFLPLNPLEQQVNGVSYPFELIKKKALDFFSNTLPILKRDESLPKVARYAQHTHIESNPDIFNSQPQSTIDLYRDTGRGRRDVSQLEAGPLSSRPSSRREKGWCEESYGVFCMLLNALRDASSSSSSSSSSRMGDSASAAEPLTPCPSLVEYVTPVFAKNYEGVWRYVVQIPYEGYFTQTVEVVKCMTNKCSYLDGSCLASPRWLSLLVAEIFYPHATFPGPLKRRQRQPVPAMSPPPQELYLKKRSGYVVEASESKSDECDGHDDLGCYQVRLYYDWFLIPGSCKCWKKDIFKHFANQK